MTFNPKNRVMETTTTTGTGTVTLAGAVTGFQTWAAISNGNTAPYHIEAVDGNGTPTGAWEAGIGTYTASGTTLARTTVRASSNSGSAVSFAAGTKRVALSPQVEDLCFVDPGTGIINTVYLPTDIAYVDTANTFTLVQTVQFTSVGAAVSISKCLKMSNTTAAAVGAQQWSPAVILVGNGWQTSDSTSQASRWALASTPVQGSTPLGTLSFFHQLAAGSWTSYGTLDANGLFTATSFAGSGAALTALDAGNISAGTLAVARGGTGLASYAIGDIIYASGATTLSKLADVATGSALISGGVTTAPSWGKIGLTTHVSGTLGADSGGTGVANNAASTITISGNFATTLTVTAGTSVTLPTTGTLATLAGSESLTNKKLGSLTTNGYVKTSGGDGTLSVGAAAVRTQLTAAVTYYVRTDGSDSNTGLVDSSGGAFLTIQKAIDVASALDNGGFDITIQVRDGTYSPAFNQLKSFVGSGSIIIQGNSGTPANVVISITGSSCFTCIGTVVGNYTIKDMKLTTTTSGSGLNFAAPCYISFSNLNFGACATYQIFASSGARIQATGDYAVSGNSTRHAYASNQGQIRLFQRTVTITGTLTMTIWAHADRQSMLEAWSMTHTLSGGATVTGKRYQVEQVSLVYTNGGGASYFPGSTAGSADATTYGAYV